MGQALTVCHTHAQQPVHPAMPVTVLPIHEASLSLHFPLCTMGLTGSPVSQSCSENTHTTGSLGPGTQDVP